MGNIFFMKNVIFKEISSAITLPEFLNSSWSLQRKKEWITARECLVTLLKEREINCNVEDLEQENFSHLKSFPQFQCSFSHSKTHGAAYIENSSEFLSIGLDIESLDRVVKEKTTKFFIHPKDKSKIADSLLKSWCIKEACFKAFSPIYKEEKVLVLSDIWISDNQFGFKEELLGTFSVYEECGHIVSVAQINKN